MSIPKGKTYGYIVLAACKHGMVVILFIYLRRIGLRRNGFFLACLEILAPALLSANCWLSNTSNKSDKKIDE